MPWHVEKRDDQWCVIKDDDGENEGCHDSEEQAQAQLRALYSSENRAPVETRSAELGKVNFPQRRIEIVAVPYDEEAVVEYRGELWRESFAPGAFRGVEARPTRIKAYRDHSSDGRSGLIGRVTKLEPDATDALKGEVRIANTPLGDETLTLADEGILGVSVGFAVRGSDQVLNRKDRTRRIRRAFLDHIAFPDEGAYAGAQVVGVRTGEQRPSGLPRLNTPRLDEVVAWLQSRG